MLLATSSAWIYQSLKGGLSLSKRFHGAEGRAYDEGELPAANGVWRVCLAANTTVDGELAYYDVRPAALLIFEERSASSAQLTPGASAAWVTGPTIRPPTRLSLSEAMHRSGESEPTTLAPDRSVSLAVERLAMQPESAGVVASTLWGFDRWREAPPGFEGLLALSASGKAPRPALFAAERTAAPPLDVSARVEGDALVAGVRALLAELPVPAPSARPAVPVAAPTAVVHGLLSRFELHAIRSLRQLAWAPEVSGPGWHVILGENASGKTSVLRCLALALLDPHGRDALREDWGSWLQKGAARGGLRATVQAAGGNPQEVALSFTRARGGNGAGPTNAVSIDPADKTYGGFLAAYGPLRRFTGGDPEWARDFHAHPRVQRVLTLFNERAILSDALEWLKDLWVRAKTIKNAPEKRFLRSLLAFVNGTDFFPAGTTLDEPDADGVWCRDRSGHRSLVIDLSHGYRAALSLALDLLRHLALEFGPDKVFAAESPATVPLTGIVLIDEPDTHLHPTWQQRIGGWFKRTFPNVQFIVATHSAFVCQSADSVLHLPAPGSDEAPRMATATELARLQYGNVLDALGTGLLGVGVEQAEAGRERLARLAELNQTAFERALTAEEEAERQGLRATLPSRAATSRIAR